MIAFGLGIGLTVAFWSELWTGGGLIGGDIYSYFFPQKQFYAESLQSGEIPLWNNRTGFGYPLIGESQTGAFYPPHVLLYPLLDVNTAYNANQLLHYVLAFVFAWMLARQLKMSQAGALFTALIYVYGWFPPRLCLEWAIVGGCWLPLAVWWLEKYLQSSNRRFLAGLSVTLAIQMLAGHYNLAFITQLLVVSFAGLRLWFWTDEVADSLVVRKPATCGITIGSLLLAFGLAAPQVLPTWELKESSQRVTIDGREFDPGHGHIPPLYLSQVVASWWFWYSPDVNRDQALAQLDTFAISSGTNEIEAHLYFGLAPLVLIGVALASSRFRRKLCTRQSSLWLIIAGFGVVYATGWLLAVTQHLPGFGFFRGPGRYGILAALGGAIIAGRAVDALWADGCRKRRLVFSSLLFLVTAADLWWVSRVVAVVVRLNRPTIANLEQSPIRKHLEDFDGLTRLHAPGPNLPNLLGVSSVPEYLGIGPGQYYTPELRTPELTRLTPTFLKWAYDSGVTHVLSFEELVTDQFPDVRLLHNQPDPFLNPAWAKPFTEPIYLYELTSAPGRVRFIEPTAGQRADVVTNDANVIELDIDTPQAATVVLTDLYWPGWSVTIDGKPAEAREFEGLFRSVEIPSGRHAIRWNYSPAIIKSGLALSAGSFIVICVFLIRRRKNDNAV